MKNPNILILSSYDVGGASIAAIRLHMGLLKLGLNSKLLTLNRQTYTIPEHYSFQPSGSFLDRIKLKINQRSEFRQKNALQLPAGESLSGKFSLPIASYDITDSPLWNWADVVNLHWVNEWISVESICLNSRNKPLVWTFHDFHALTGGCHYPKNCAEFTHECKTCHYLTNSNIPNLANQFWKSKKAALSLHKPNLTVSTPSNWMKEMVESSSLFGGFPVETILNGIDPDTFKILDIEACRNVLGIPKHKKVLLTVSQSLKDERKGFAILLDALEKLKNPENWLLCTVGKLNETFSELPVEHIHLGTINDEKLMAIAYNSADYFIHPALEDNLPNVVVEALCCGLPVSGFTIGGMPEMVVSGINGALSEKRDATSLANCIEFLDTLQLSRSSISDSARKKFSFLRQAKEFEKLFNKVADLG